MHIFVKRDLDGFFGLAIDNLVQLLLIVTLCGSVCGMNGDQEFYIYRFILPGAAVSLLIGNLFYALQAHWLAYREGRSDVTALPYGINTPSLLVYIYFVMMPAYRKAIAGGATQGDAAHLAWQLGLVACLGSGLIEFFGAFVAERLRRNTPRAALLGTLAGIAIAFISMLFALQIWQRPLIALLPLGIILLTYFARMRFPLGLPGGFLAVAAGTGLAWLLSWIAPGWIDINMSTQAVREAWSRSAVHAERIYWPQWVGPEIWDAVRSDPAQILTLLSVIIPMGLFNLVGSLQNIESAEAGGDIYATGPSLAANGIGTLAAACFGSCFPTTIYIGHPGWKALGARAGYSTLNGLVMSVICVTGTILVIDRVVPIEAGIAIVLWIGVIITAQAFQATPLRHAPAVALGLFPAIAAWGATVVAGAFITAAPPAVAAATPSASAPAAELRSTEPGTASTSTSAPTVRTMQDVLESTHEREGLQSAVNGFLIHGMNILERGYIFTCMILAAIAAFLIDRRFRAAAGWALAAAILTLAGLMHAYQLSGNVVDYLPILARPQPGAFSYRAFDLAAAYALLAVLFFLAGRGQRRGLEPPAENTVHAARVVEISEPDNQDSVPSPDPA